MIDQENYLAYFANTPDLLWLEPFASPYSVVTWLLRFFSEEAMWLTWASALGSVFPADFAVRFTTAVVSLLIVLAAREYRHPWLALLLWITIPQGLAVVGTYQIRQGFAFAVLLYFGAKHARLIMAVLGAAMIHTTFAALVPFALVSRLRVPAPLKLLIVGVTAIALAAFGNYLFEMYGGRRVETYLVDEGATSLNFLLGLLIPLPYTVWLYIAPDKRSSMRDDRPLRDFVLLYIGVVSFLVASVFLFPLGTARLAYYLTLGLIPILANLRYGQILKGRVASMAVLVGVIPIMVFLSYLAVRAAADDRYACLTTKNCADVLSGK